MGDTDLTGRTAIVTGASRGIGLAVARSLAAHGAQVVLTSRHQSAADEAARDVGAGSVGVEAHVTDEAAARACVDGTVERFGSVDILVNNAGTNPSFGPVLDQDHGRFAKTLDINLWGPSLWTGLVWRAWMRDHGGVVVNNASLGGLVAGPDLGVYHASKAGLIHLTSQMALELGPRVRVNAVAPGVVRTRLAEALWQEHEQEVADKTPLGRIGEPGNVADAVLFLASDMSCWITGETLVVDGGQRHGAPARPPR